jgi:rhodanese-related sulfurtransferase
VSLLHTLSWATLKLLIRVRFPQVKSLTVAELAAWLNQSPPPLLLDARSPMEYQVSHLPNAQLAPANLSNWQPTICPTQPIVTYCSVGYRSAVLANQLRQHGFQQVWNLEGSIFEWANAGYPVYRQQQQVGQVHPYNALWGNLLRAELRSPN